MTKILNLAMMSTNTVGAGNAMTLGAAVPSYLTFAQAGALNGDELAYAIEDGNNREMGHGIYNSAGPTLTRNVETSTNNNDRINLSGNAEVGLVATAADFEAGPGAKGSNIHVGSAAPPDPKEGDAWLNVINNLLQVRDATGWRSLGYLPLTGGTLTGAFSVEFDGMAFGIWSGYNFYTSFPSEFDANVQINGALSVGGILTLSGDASANLQAVPLQQLNTAIANIPASLPLTGGTVTGATTFNGTVNAPNLQGFLPLSGGSITTNNTIALGRNATANLEAVPLQQLNSAIAAIPAYLPLSGGTLSGPITLPGFTVTNQFTASTIVLDSTSTLESQPRGVDFRWQNQQRFRISVVSDFLGIFRSTDGSSFNTMMSIGRDGSIVLLNLPIIDPRVSGQLWRSGNQLMVSTG